MILLRWKRCRLGGAGSGRRVLGQAMPRHVLVGMRMPAVAAMVLIGAVPARVCSRPMQPLQGTCENWVARKRHAALSGSARETSANPKPSVNSV